MNPSSSNTDGNYTSRTNDDDYTGDISALERYLQAVRLRMADLDPDFQDFPDFDLESVPDFGGRGLGFFRPGKKMTLTGVTSKAIRKGDPEPPLASGKFRIYNMRFCPWAERAMIYVAAKGIEAEVINLNVTDKPEWFYSKHYQGKAPAIEHDGKIVIESGFIPEYLDDAFPEPRILPTDPYEKVQQKLLADRLTMVAHAVPQLFAVMRDRNLKNEKQEKVFEVLQQAENLLVHDFYAGSAPGYPDYLTFPFFEKIWWSASLDNVVDLPVQGFPGSEKFPKLTSWFERILNSDVVQSVTQPIEFGAQFMNAYATHGTLNYDLGL